MAKRVLLLDNSTPYKSNAKKVATINWKLCVLCQEEKNEPLSYPNGRTGATSQSAYISIATEMTKLNDLGVMPNNLDIDLINDGSGIQQTLEKYKAGYHRKCRLKFSTVLNRTEKKIKKKSDNDSNDSNSPVKTRKKMSPTPTKKNICYFCENPTGIKDLHAVTTLNFDNNVKIIATELGIKKLLTKLAVKDMIADDAMYHRNCYMDLRNRYRSHQRKINNQHKLNKVSVDSLVLAELVAYIKETSDDSENVIVFKLSDLTEKYKIRLAEIKGVARDDNFRSHTLKIKLIEHIPELWAEKQGKEVFLTLNENIGSAIHYALNSDMDKDAVKLANAAQVVRKEIFEMSYEFSGVFEDDCELNSVPKSLIALVQMILEGSSFDKMEINSNTARSNISVAIAQLLYFNTVKKARSNAAISHEKEQRSTIPNIS